MLLQQFLRRTTEHEIAKGVQKNPWLTLPGVQGPAVPKSGLGEFRLSKAAVFIFSIFCIFSKVKRLRKEGGDKSWHSYFQEVDLGPISDRPFPN